MENNFSQIQQGASTLIDSISAKVKELSVEIGTLNTNVTNLFNQSSKSNGLQDQVKTLEKEIKKLNFVMTNQKTQLATLTSAQNNFNSSSKQGTDEIKSKIPTLSQLTRVNKSLGDAYTVLVDKQRQARETLRSLIIEQGKNSAETRKAQIEYDKLTSKVNEANKATSNFIDARNSRTGASSTIPGMGIKITDYKAKEQERNNASLGNSYGRLIEQQIRMKATLDNLIITKGKDAAETIRLQKAYNKVSMSVNKADNTFSSFSRGGIKGALGRVKNLLGAFGILGGTQLLASLGKNMFNLTKQFDSFRFAMQKTIPDALELAETQKFLDEITTAYGVDLITTTERFIKFDAAARQSNVSMVDTQKIFGSVTKAAGVLGLKTDELSGAYLALEQMLSKGKVTTEELRRQLGERLPGAFGIMANALGVTTAKLDKMLRAGEVLSSEALPKFAIALEKAYGIEAVKTVDTLQAAQTRLTNVWQMFVRDLSGSDSLLQGAFKGVLSFMSSVLENIKDIGDEIKEAFTTGAEKAVSEAQNKFNAHQKRQIDALNTYTDKQERLAEAIRLRFALEEKIKNVLIEQGKERGFTVNPADAEEQARALVDLSAKYQDYNKFIEDNSTLITQNAKNAVATAFVRIKGIDSVINKTQEQIELEEEAIDPKKGKGGKEEKDYRLQDAHELERALLKIKIAGAKDILDNEEASYEERFLASENYFDLKTALIDLETDYEKSESVGRTDKIKQIEAEKQNELTNLTKEGTENRNKIIEDEFKKTLKFYEDMKSAADVNITTELTALKNELIKSGATREEIEKKVTEREKELRKESLINFIENEIAKVKAKAVTAENMKQIAAELAELEAMLADAMMPDAVKIEKADKALKSFLQNFQDEFFSEAGFDKLNEFFFTFDEKGMSLFDNLLAEADTSLEKFQVYFGAISEVAQEAFSFINQRSQAMFDQQYENLERQKDIAILFAGESAEARAEIERQYEAKRRKIQRAEAKAQKEQALFNIAVNTAQAIVATLGKTGFAGIPLAAIVGAIGVAQLALVAATPVPEFFRGTQNAPEGYAKVDEKRPEVHTDRWGKVKSMGGDKANYRYLSAGDKIYTSHEEYFNRELGGILQGNNIMPYNNSMSLDSPVINIENKNDISPLTRELKALRKDVNSRDALVINLDKNGVSARATKNGMTREMQNNILTLKRKVV